MCSICQDDEVECAHALEPCGHTFHANCIIDWFRRGHSTCPECRDDPGEAPIDGLTIRARAQYLQQVARRKDAPPDLKRVVQRWRESKRAMKSVNQQIREHRREHRAALSTLSRLVAKRRATWLRIRNRERLMGCYHSATYPLPPLVVITYDD